MVAMLHKFSKKAAELVVLALLNKGPAHGYQIVQTLCAPEKRDRTLCIDEGTLYPLLYRMEKGGLIEGRWLKVGKKRKQRRYSITDKGRSELKSLRSCWGSVTTAVEHLLTAKT